MGLGDAFLPINYLVNLFAGNVLRIEEFHIAEIEVLDREVVVELHVAHIELPGDDVGDEARAVLADKVDFVTDSVRKSFDAVDFVFKPECDLRLLVPWRNGELLGTDVAVRDFRH